MCGMCRNWDRVHFLLPNFQGDARTAKVQQQDERRIRRFKEHHMKDRECSHQKAVEDTVVSFLFLVCGTGPPGRILSE